MLLFSNNEKNVYFLIIFIIFLIYIIKNKFIYNKFNIGKLRINLSLFKNFIVFFQNFECQKRKSRILNCEYAIKSNKLNRR